MKRNSLLLATALLIGMTGCKNTPVQKEAWISNALDAASYQLKSTAEELSGQAEQLRATIAFFQIDLPRHAPPASSRRAMPGRGKPALAPGKKATQGARIELADKGQDSDFESF